MSSSCSTTGGHQRATEWSNSIPGLLWCDCQGVTQGRQTINKSAYWSRERMNSIDQCGPYMNMESSEKPQEVFNSTSCWLASHGQVLPQKDQKGRFAWAWFCMILLIEELNEQADWLRGAMRRRVELDRHLQIRVFKNDVWHYDMGMMAPADSYIVRILAQLCLGFRVLFATKGKVMQKKHASRFESRRRFTT